MCCRPSRKSSPRRTAPPAASASSPCSRAASTNGSRSPDRRPTAPTRWSRRSSPGAWRGAGRRRPTARARARAGRRGYDRAVSLPFDSPIQPMLSSAAERLPGGDGWLFEPKWDGFRTLVFRDGADILLQSRDEKPMNRYFPELLAPLGRALPERCVVDGEVVIVGAGGLDFEALLLRIHPAASRVKLLAEQSPASFVAWDLLALGDEDLREAPLAERARLRENALEGHPCRDWADAQSEATATGQRMPGASSRWNRGKDLSWEPLRPERVCEVAYDHMQGTRFRHAAQFVRWRPDKRPRDCRYDQLEVTPAYELERVFGARDSRRSGSKSRQGS